MLRDVCAIGGLGLVALCAYLIYPPAAAGVVGLALMGAGLGGYFLDPR